MNRLVAGGLLAVVSATLWAETVTREAPEKYWNFKELSAVPAVRPCTAPESQYKDFEALLVKGKGPNGAAADFFCYFAKPQGPVPQGGFPGVVLVHGGGGTAYPNYIERWRSRGFAVMAIDWYNQRPAPGNAKASLSENSTPRVPLEGGKRQDHVANVANMVLAHSLLLARPEVNPKKTVFVGLSWGSWYGAIVAAVDPRFNGVVEIYCGDLNPAHKGQFEMINGRFLHAAKVPVWWTVSTNDNNASPETLQAAFDECPTFDGCASVIHLPHSHIGFAFENVMRMALHYADGQTRLPKLGKATVSGTTVSAPILSRGKGLARAAFCYTTDGEEPLTHKRVWFSAPATIDGDVVKGHVPDGVAQCCLAVYEADEGRFHENCGTTGFVTFGNAAKPVGADRRADRDAYPSAPPIEKWGFRKEISDGIDASGIPVMPKGAKPWLENRISRCFFGPIKRPPFNRDELMDDIDYYPDAYLAQLRDEGVNGLWLTVEFRDLVETSFNHRHPTAAKRLAKLRKTVEKCAKYGIGIWIFAIEPRCGNASPEFYAANKDLFSPAYWPPCDDWDHVTCPSKPKARQYLKEALKDLFTQVPGLRGFLNITHGERWTTCFSEFQASKACEYCPLTCPVCSKRQPWEVLNDIIVPVRDGIKEANPNADFICWFYMAEMSAEKNDWVYDCAKHFPKGASLQMNFESGILAPQEGRPRLGGDYWLSQPGPSDIFKKFADVARASGTRISAKIQASTSHEMATVPYVPVPGLLYRKFKGMHDCGVKDAMYCWYFGCNPGLMNRAAGLLSCEDFKDGEDAFLMRLAASDWGEDAARMAKLWKKCSDAYSYYPVANTMQYYGPFHDGVVWELHADLDLMPLARTWIRDRASGDTIGDCLEGFTLDEACSLAEKMCAELEDTSDLDALAAKYAKDVRRSRELGVMKAFRILCRSGRDVLKFYRARRDAILASRVKKDNVAALASIAEMRRLVVNAKEYSSQMIPLCEKDSRLGFHSEAETYKFHPALLKWRIRQLDRVIDRLVELERDLAMKKGATFPLSDWEKNAPVWNATRDASGGIVIEGDCAPDRKDDVTISLYDPTGSSYPAFFKAKNEKGRFRAVIPAGDWGWVTVHRPGLADLPAVKEPVPARLKFGTAAVRNCARLVFSR